MQTYKVPQNLHEEEKLIGGLLSLRQTAYIVIGGVLGLLLAYLIPGSMTVKISLFSIPIVLSLAIGFGKIYDLSFDFIIVLLFKFYRSKKQFRYERSKRIW